MGREIYNIINDMAEILNASQMQKLQDIVVQLRKEHLFDARKCDILDKERRYWMIGNSG